MSGISTIPLKDTKLDPSYQTMFGELKTSAKTTILELQANYGVAALRDITAVTNTGAVTNDGTEYLVKSGTTTASTARLDSAERGRYMPGSECQWGIGVRVPATAITGGQLIDGGLVGTGGSGGNRSGLASLSSTLYVASTQPVTLCVRRLTGTNATVTAVLKWAEQW